MDRGRRQRGFKFSAGDWTCSNGSCRNVNFARRDRCNLCNKERDDRGGGGGGSFGGGGGSFGGGGGGFREEGRGRGRGRGGGGGGRGGNSLFAPEDWDCSKCGNVNWARRDRCFRCDTPKGMGGGGGGGGGGGRNFNDDEIGYLPPNRDGPFDDDYDDFKRRPSEKPFSGRPLFDEDECGPVDFPSMRNGSRFEGPRGGRGGGGGGFRGRGGGGRGRGGGGGFRGRGGGFRGRDRSRSPLNNRF